MTCQRVLFKSQLNIIKYFKTRLVNIFGSLSFMESQDPVPETAGTTAREFIFLAPFMLCFSWECLHNPWLKWTLTPKFIFSVSSLMPWFGSYSTTASLSQLHCSQWISINAAELGAGLGLKDLMEQMLKSKGKDFNLGLFRVWLQKTKLGLPRRGWMWPEKEQVKERRF